MTSDIYEAAIEAVVKGDVTQAVDAANRGLKEGVDPLDLLNQGFIPGITRVGDAFDMGTLFIPELILSANAM